MNVGMTPEERTKLGGGTPIEQAVAWRQRALAAEQRAEDLGKAATALSADVTALGERAEKAEAALDELADEYEGNLRVAQEKLYRYEHASGMAEIDALIAQLAEAREEIERLRAELKHEWKQHEEHWEYGTQIKAHAERLAENLRELDAWVGRMPGGALALSDVLRTWWGEMPKVDALRAYEEGKA